MAEVGTQTVERTRRRGSDPGAVEQIASAARLSRVQDAQALLRRIEAELSSDRGLFDGLRDLPTPCMHACLIKMWHEDCENVLIKKCGSTEAIYPGHAGMHGADTALYDRFIEMHRTLVESGTITPKGYVLVPIRHYGVVELWSTAYLVMERLATVYRPRLCRGEGFDLDTASNELREHLRIMGRCSPATLPQWYDRLALGNTSTGEPGMGSWILALPIDFE